MNTVFSRQSRNLVIMLSAYELLPIRVMRIIISIRLLAVSSVRTERRYIRRCAKCTLYSRQCRESGTLSRAPLLSFDTNTLKQRLQQTRAIGRKNILLH